MPQILDAKKCLFYAIIFGTYLVLGSLVFQALELENEREERRTATAIRAAFRRKYNISYEDWSSIESLYLASYVPHFWRNATTWSFGNALVFAGSVITTVGYGNITPRTAKGRLFCILYAFLGIPLTCITLKTIGQNLLDLSVLIMATIKKRFHKRFMAAPQAQPCPDIGRGSVLAVIGILWLSTLVALSALAHSRRGWGLFESLYFCFITFSTIGFGDYVPFSESAASDYRDYLIMLVGVVLGFAVTSTMLCSLCSLFEESWTSCDCFYGTFPGKATRALRERLRRLGHTPDVKVAPAQPEPGDANLKTLSRRRTSLAVHCHPASTGPDFSKPD